MMLFYGNAALFLLSIFCVSANASSLVSGGITNISVYVPVFYSPLFYSKEVPLLFWLRNWPIFVEALEKGI